MMEYIPLKNEHKSILIKTVYMESMNKEFDPGPNEKDPFPELYNARVEVFLVDTSEKDPKMDLLDYEGVKKYYKDVLGRNARISYFYIMKYLGGRE